MCTYSYNTLISGSQLNYTCLPQQHCGEGLATFFPVTARDDSLTIK